MEPIAIVGMACRFPGAMSPEAYWKLLLAGTEAVGAPPHGRPELEPPPWLVAEAPASRRGGFLHDIRHFEPGFFRISAREGARMDPQQRLLLEVAWEALEDAGQPPGKLAGSTSAVFVGVMNADFARRHAQDLTRMDAQLGPGSALGIAANRISFFLDLRGPSMSVDTLCSSSLVAIHLACQSLRSDEASPVALAGGVNIILDRAMDVFYARAGLLSSDGRCRAFDASARGIVRGEGVGMLVLKRLSRARADGDRIHGVILGSAVNQDGRSNGLTSPSRWSQEEVLRTAYQRAGVAPSRVAYIEAHGTGTLIGDPIEAAALGAVLAENRAPGSPCAIGSVKTNLGHLESAAGIASVIKAVLSLQQRTLVPSLNFDTPNPYLRLAERGLRVPTRVEPWPDAEPLAGVSSFGMGGTNAHIVLGPGDPHGRELGETAPMPRARQSELRAALIPISARSSAALDVLTARYREMLCAGELSLADMAHSTGARRDHHDHRRALVALSHGKIVASSADVVVPGRAHKLVFVLPEQLAWDGEARGELAASEPAFRAALAQHLAAGATPLAAYQAALIALWSAYGFEPDAIVHVREDEPAAVVEHLGEDSTVFVEISPRATLRDGLRAALARAGVAGAALSSHDPVLAERASWLNAVGALYCLGFEVDWRRFDAPDARFVALGSYPWQREYCWLEPAPQPPTSALPHGVLVPRWSRVPAAAPRPSPRATWLVLGNGGATARALVTRLAEAGHEARTADTLHEGEKTAQNVVLFCGADLGTTLRVVQALMRAADATARLWLVTRGAVVVDGESVLASLDSATAWGFGRVLTNEQPRLRSTLLDLSPSEQHEDAAWLCTELLSDSDERELALRATGRYVARLAHEPVALPRARLRLPAEAAYLVTGGLGGLGLAAAQRLVERGARTVILASRRGVASERAKAAIAAMRAHGAKVIVAELDVANRDAVAALLRSQDVHGVIHAAGVMSPGMISTLAPSELAELLAAKVAGARHLHALTAERPLAFFVMYSSVATLLGMPGQAAYAAGNAYLDALAQFRRAHGLPATSIAWTVIADTGMAEGAGEKALEQLADRGVASLSLRDATDVLENALSSETPPHFGAVRFDAARWAAFYPHTKAMPRFAALSNAQAASRSDARDCEAARGAELSAPTPAELRAPTPAELRALTPAELRSLTQEDRLRLLVEWLSKAAATVLHHPGVLPRDRSLLDLGLDSLMAMELQSLVEEQLALEMPTEQLLRGPSIQDLAQTLAAQLSGAAPLVAAPVSLRDEARLDPALTFTLRPAAKSRSIFLTGATGFLGAFVLAELLTQSAATIHCLVRARSASEGLRRLEEVLNRYGLAALDLAARVTCVPGDLAQPRLGLDEAEFARLASAVDTIIHSGASVNFVFPYEALKASNVDGTHEVLRLAAAAGAKLHHVSTIGVFPGGQARGDTVLEGARPDQPEHLPLGYMRAKWVAEELVMQACARGLDASIFRPGTISGHAVSGAFNPEDFVCALIKGCVQLGIAPSVDTQINLAPVDYVSRALVRIALDASSSGQYHLVGPAAVAWRDIVRWIRELGYPLAELPYPAWRTVLLERAQPTANALAPLLPLFAAHENTDWLYLPPYDDARTTEALTDSTIACPNVDAALIRRYIERFITNQYLPRPPAAK